MKTERRMLENKKRMKKKSWETWRRAQKAKIDASMLYAWDNMPKGNTILCEKCALIEKAVVQVPTWP